MKYKRKITAVILIASVLAVFPFSVSTAQSNIIYEKKASEIITSGVTHENIVRFTDDGWLNINILRVDLFDPYIKVDNITNKSSIKKLSSVKTLSKDWGAVAAINGDFFSSAGSGSGYPDGPVIQSGEMISASGEFNRYGDTMASFSIDSLNNILYSYWKTEIELITGSGSTLSAAQYNKPSLYNYTDLVILDRRWGEQSIGASETYPDIVEMVVVGDKVTEIRQSQPAVAIPENGYVVVSRLSGNVPLVDNFKVGDTVNKKITTTPDWDNLKMVVSGSSILVKDGKIPDKFSFDTSYISKSNPRSVVGNSKDGKQLILVTVDGRQNSSIGLTQMETAQLMLELGAYNALNLDGGGSTTMVTRAPGTSDINIVNSPSDGAARSIASAIGIFSIAPPSALSGLIIDTEDINVFVGTSRTFTVKGFDRYFNPIEVDPEQINWSVSGIKGSFKGNTFYPTTVGEGKVTAKIGDITASINISSLSAPVSLTLNKKSVTLSAGQSVSFTASGMNKNGYNAVIDPQDIKWSVSGKIGTVEAGVFTASAKGTGYIDASVIDTHAYSSVCVGLDTSTVKDSFEKQNGTFLGYPNTVTGNFEISNEQKYQGKYSGKLTYDFTDNIEVSRAAYMVLPDNGLQLKESTTKIGVWVYNSYANSDWLRGEVVDSAGAKHTIEFVKTMGWTGWKYVEASLEGIKSPSFLTRLYIVQTNPVADSGSIYLDDLTVTTSEYPQMSTDNTPKDTVQVDDANKHIDYVQSKDSFRFSVLGQTAEPKNPLEKLLMQKFSEKINKYLEAAAFVGQGTHKITGSLEKPAVSTNTGYESFDMKNSKFIKLDISKKGLRLSDKDQWRWFLQELDSAAAGGNIFIFLTDSPQAFSDPLEAKLFKDTLTQYRQTKFKNIWVFFKGTENTSYMERGIKYISSAGLEVQGLVPENTDAAQYVLVTVRGTSVTFEFKPIV